MDSTEEARPFVLRDLRLTARIVIAAYLVTVGIGYFSALVQLHFQNASPGRLLPDAEDAAASYYGHAQLSQFERLLTTDESKPFNGSGTMRPAFTDRSAGWKREIGRKAKILGLAQAKEPEDKRRILLKAESDLLSERNGERLALLDWVHNGADPQAFEADAYPLSPALARRPITADFVEIGPDGGKRLKILTLLDHRCMRCHSETAGGQASEFPLETYDQILEYCSVETTGGGMSLKKLAQSTHVHMLGFAMLYGLTGFIFAHSSYPGWLRAVLAPLPLVAQVVDIGCWWLGRVDPFFARAIVYTGAVAGVALCLQLFMTLLNLFDTRGKLVLAVILLAGAVAGYFVKTEVIDPYLLKEGLSASALE